MSDNKMQELDLENLDDPNNELLPLDAEEEVVEEEEAPTATKEETTDAEDVQQGTEEDEEADEKPIRREERKESRAQKRIRELVAQRKQAEEQARQILEEKRQLESELRTFKKATVTSQKELIKDSVVAAKKQLKTALESGDHESIVEAQAALNTAQMRQTAIDSVVEEEDDVEPAVEYKPQQQQVDAPEAMLDWLDRNPWFQNPRNQNDQLLIQSAVAFYGVLVAKGEDPESSDFYDLIDEKLGLSDADEDAAVDRTTKNSVKSVVTAKPSSDDKTVTREKKKISQTVQGSSRTPPQTRSTKIQLTVEQQRIADSMGISHLAYAKELKKIEEASKRGDKMVELF
jgi:hypothetical protein